MRQDPRQCIAQDASSSGTTVAIAASATADSSDNDGVQKRLSCYVEQQNLAAGVIVLIPARCESTIWYGDSDKGGGRRERCLNCLVQVLRRVCSAPLIIMSILQVRGHGESDEFHSALQVGLNAAHEIIDPLRLLTAKSDNQADLRSI